MLQALFGRGMMRKNHQIPKVRDIRGEDDVAFLAKSKAHLEALEEVRKEKFASYNWRKRIAIPAAVICTPILGYVDYLLLFMHRAGDDGGAGLSAAFLGGVYWWVTQPKRQYAVAYKQKILPEIAKLFGDFQYTLKGAIPVTHMLASKILPRHDKIETEDYFNGTYKGVDIQFCEIDFQQKRRSKNRTYYASVFKGLVILLDMKSKKFYGHTMLDKDRNKITEWFKEKSRDLKRANLVDPEFEKIFDVYTNDQVEARYLIDPVMIERLKGLQAEYEGDNLTAAFYESKMLVLIESKHNHFEPADLYIPATDPRSIMNMKREIGEILSLIDRLNLYDPNEVHNSDSGAVV